MEMLEHLRRATGLTQVELRAVLFIGCLFLAGWIGRSVTSQPVTHEREAAQRVIAILDSIARQQHPTSSSRPVIESPVTFNGRSSTGIVQRSVRTVISPVSLSRATLEQLDQLPGIGPSTAAAIIDERARQPFRRIEDLGRVRGIGPKKIEKLRPYVRVP